MKKNSTPPMTETITQVSIKAIFKISPLLRYISVLKIAINT